MALKTFYTTSMCRLFLIYFSLISNEKRHFREPINLQRDLLEKARIPVKFAIATVTSTDGKSRSIETYL